MADRLLAVFGRLLLIPIYVASIGFHLCHAVGVVYDVLADLGRQAKKMVRRVDTSFVSARVCVINPRHDPQTWCALSLYLFPGRALQRAQLDWYIDAYWLLCQPLAASARFPNPDGIFARHAGGVVDADESLTHQEYGDPTHNEW